jgi:hypothetical protein
VHAGVIEPGHFRSVHGEIVLHLEISLGISTGRGKAFPERRRSCAPHGGVRLGRRDGGARDAYCGRWKRSREPVTPGARG